MDINDLICSLNTCKALYFRPNTNDITKKHLKEQISLLFSYIPVNTRLCMIIEDHSVSWNRYGSVSSSSHKILNLYKRGYNTWSRYKDGSGVIEEDSLPLTLLYNSGEIMLPEKAKELLDESITIQTREITNISEGKGVSRVKTYKL